MIKRFVLFAVVFTALFILAVACNNTPEQQEKLVDVTLVSVVEDEKTLKITGLSELSKYSYTATPLFSAKSEDPSQGSQVKTTEKITSSSQTFKNLSQGKWKFEVTGYNENNKKMYYGSVEKDVSSSTGTVKIVMGSSYEEGTGTLTLKNIKAPKIGSSPKISYTVSNYDGELAKATTSTDNSNEFDLSDEITLSEGLHTVVITNYDGTTPVGGEIVTVKIVDGDSVEITGMIDTGTYQDVTVNAVEFSSELKKDTPSKGKYKAVLSDSLPTDFDTSKVTYAWYLNGVCVSADTDKPEVYTFAPEYSGYYCITCIVSYVNGSVSAVSSSSLYVDFIKADE